MAITGRRTSDAPHLYGGSLLLFEGTDRRLLKVHADLVAPVRRPRAVAAAPRSRLSARCLRTGSLSKNAIPWNCPAMSRTAERAWPLRTFRASSRPFCRCAGVHRPASAREGAVHVYGDRSRSRCLFSGSRPGRSHARHPSRVTGGRSCSWRRSVPGPFSRSISPRAVFRMTPEGLPCSTHWTVRFRGHGLAGHFTRLEQQHR